MPESPYYTEPELRALGLAACGERVRISRKASIYGACRIAMGGDVRIEDFCVLSAGGGGIRMGWYIHIAVYCSLIGRGAIEIGDFSNFSSRISIYSSNDDYSGAAMTNPLVPEEFTGVQHAPVTIGRHVIVGSGAVILPGAVLEEGVAVGALSLVPALCEAFGV